MSEPSEKKPRVVLVDDELMMRQMLKAILNESGYEVVGEAMNGEEALGVCRRSKPDAVCLDILMPKMDGLEALPKLHEAVPGAVIIMISADASSSKVQEAIRLGATGFIVKPFNANKVLQSIEQAIARKSAAKPGET